MPVVEYELIQYIYFDLHLIINVKIHADFMSHWQDTLTEIFGER